MNNRVGIIKHYLSAVYEDVNSPSMCTLNKEQCHMLMDYIHELEKYKNEATRKHWQTKCAEHHMNEIIYKSRIDKAIDFIKTYEVYLYPMQDYGKEKYILREENEGIRLLNILDGKEDTNEE